MLGGVTRRRRAAAFLSIGVAATTAGTAAAQLPGLPGSSSPPPPQQTTAAPPVTPVTPQREARGAGLDAAHTGWSADPDAAPPYVLKWSVKLPGDPDTPLVADGRVFVSTSKGASGTGNGYGQYVLALDPASGKQLWRVAVASTYFSIPLAYDSGRLYGLDGDGKVHAFDPATGTEQWVAEGSRSSANGSPFAAGSGTVAVARETTLVLLDGATGREVAVAALSEQGGGSVGRPAISGDRVYAADGRTVAAFDRRDGRRLWSTAAGGDERAVRLVGDRVVVGSSVLQASDGKVVTGAVGGTVLTDTTSLTLGGGVLTALDRETGVARWTRGARTAGSFLAVGSTVVVRSGAMLTTYDLATGTPGWSGVLPNGTGYLSGGGITQDLAAGGGMLLAPGDGKLTAVTRGTEPRPTLTVKDVRKLRVVVYGQRVTLTGTARTTGLQPTTRLTLTTDPFPLGGPFGRPKVKTVAFGTPFTLAPRPSRNTRYRVQAGDGERATVLVVVLPRFGVVRTGATSLRLSAHVPRSVRLRGKTIGAYLFRRGGTTYRRLAAGRLSGGRGTFRANVRFRPISPNSKDLFVLCVRGIHRQGMSFGDALDRGCGAAAVRLR